LNLVDFWTTPCHSKVVFNRAKVLAGRRDADIVKVFGVQEIIVSLENVDHTRLINVLDVATSTDAVVKISSPLYDGVPERLFIEKYGNLPVVGISHFNPSPTLEVYKRLFDSVVAAIGVGVPGARVRAHCSGSPSGFTGTDLLFSDPDRQKRQAVQVLQVPLHAGRE
jgi:hypothetical protein